MTTGALHSPAAQRGHLAGLFLAVVLLASVYPALAGSSYRGSNDLHAALEVVGSMVGLVAGLSFVVHFRLLGDRAYLFIGLAFFVNGAEDLAHGLLSSRIFQELLGTPASSLEHFIPGTYVAGRLLMAGLLVAAMLVPRQLVEGADPGRQTLRVSVAVIGGAVILTALAFAMPLPTFMFPDRLISRPVDAASAALFAGAGFAFLREYRRTGSTLTWWILLSIVVNAVGQALMAFSSALYDPFFDVAHAYKALGYLIPLWAFALYQTVTVKEKLRDAETLVSRAGELEDLVALRTDELRLAHEVLRKEERGMRLILKTTPVAMLLSRLSDGKALFANDAACKLMGVPVGEFEGRAVSDFYADPAQRDAVIQDLRQRGKVEDKEIELIAADGKKVIVLMAATKTLFEGTEAALSSVVDITERKKAERHANLQRQRVSSYNAAIMGLAATQVDASPDLAVAARRVTEIVSRTIGTDRMSVWLFSDDKTKLRCIDLFERKLGAHSAGSVLEESDFPAYFVALLSERIVAVDDAAADPRTSAFEEPYLVPNRIASMLDASIRVGGAVLGVLCAEQQGACRRWIEDEGLFVAAAADYLAGVLTAEERELARGEASAAAAQWRQLVDTANAPIFGVDTERRINEWNQQVAKVTGYTAEAAMGRDLVADFVTLDFQDSVSAVVEAALVGEGTVNFELPLLTKGGDRIELLVSATPRRDLDGNVLGMIGVGQDITERVRAEQELEAERAQLAARVEERTADLSRANAELGAASRAKDEFLASMSHELRTPLNAVLATSESLQEGVYGDLTGRQSSSIELIAESGRHLLDLINDILDLSKIEAGRFDLALDEFVVEDVCEASLRFVKETATLKNISISRPSGLAGITMRGDARRVKQILVNLLSNAVKFTPEGGEVGLEVTADGEQEVMCFSVWDTGIGIDREDQELLFRPFVQLDAGLDRHFEGTGLGLSLVARLAELHGGSVQLQSEGADRGSRFSVRLPWNRPVPDDPAATSSTVPDGEHRTAEKLALLVEDSPSSALQLSRYLESAGIETILVGSAEGVVEIIADRRPDVVLVDLVLPGESGFELLANIRSDERTNAIPAIAVSVLDEAERALAAGATLYLRKPVTRNKLHLALQEVGLSPGDQEHVVVGAASERQRPLILLAEDSEANITATADYLEAKGLHLVVARDGAEAVRMTREVHPDLILMDIQMPGVDGIEATRQIRQDPEFEALPIIALTALAMPGDRERCLAAGATEYMSKPVKLATLRATIERLLDGRPLPAEGT